MRVVRFVSNDANVGLGRIEEFVNYFKEKSGAADVTFSTPEQPVSDMLGTAKKG